MAYQTLRFEKAGRIARIVLNRPERLNAISAEMPGELEAAVAAANDDPEVRVIILKGEGRAFCAGFDLSPGLYTGPPMGEWDPTLDFAMTTHFARQFMSLWYSRKPTIAQVHGWCVAGGTDLALCSDIIVAAEDARMGYPPARVWGSPLTAMWVYRLSAERAKSLLLTGDPVDGRTAERIGLIYRAVPARTPGGGGRGAGRAHGEHPRLAARRHEAAGEPGLREHGPEHDPAPGLDLRWADAAHARGCGLAPAHRSEGDQGGHPGPRRALRGLQRRGAEPEVIWWQRAICLAGGHCKRRWAVAQRVILRVKVTRKRAIMNTPMSASPTPRKRPAQPWGSGAQAP